MKLETFKEKYRAVLTPEMLEDLDEVIIFIQHKQIDEIRDMLYQSFEIKKRN